MKRRQILVIWLFMGLLVINGRASSWPETEWREIDFIVRNIYERIVKGDAEDIKLVCVVDPVILAARHDLHPREATMMSLICGKMKVALAYELELFLDTPPTAKIGNLIAIQSGFKGDGSAPIGRVDTPPNLAVGVVYIVPLVRGFSLPEDGLIIEFKSPRAQPLQERLTGLLQEHQDIQRVFRELGYEEIIHDQNSWTTAGLGVSRAVSTRFSVIFPPDITADTVELRQSLPEGVSTDVRFYHDIQKNMGLWSDYLKDEGQGEKFIARANKLLDDGLESEEGRMLSRKLADHVASRTGEATESVP